MHATLYSSGDAFSCKSAHHVVGQTGERADRRQRRTRVRDTTCLGKVAYDVAATVIHLGHNVEQERVDVVVQRSAPFDTGARVSSKTCGRTRRPRGTYL